MAAGPCQDPAGLTWASTWRVPAVPLCARPRMATDLLQLCSKGHPLLRTWRVSRWAGEGPGS
jgi:hypothetical protein